MRTRLLLLFLTLFAVSDGQKVPDEFKDHFNVEQKQLETVEELLIKMKKLAHARTYKGREFGNDAVADSKKEVQISSQQAAVDHNTSPFLFEGDIFLNKNQAVGILKEISKIEPKKKRTRRSFVADKEAMWKTLPIKYRFHESIDFFTISQIIAAIRQWESLTCLTFENIQEGSEGEDYIEFFKGQGCYSMIGRNGGRQGVSIGENCVKLGVIEHEIGHALGLWHEQSRPDALSYIKIEQDFILPSFISDFLQRDNDIDTLGIPYDLGSVMHYGSTAFSSDQTSKTVVTRDKVYQMTIGQREKVSFYDVAVINKAYCKASCEGEKTKCTNGGYPNPSDCSVCICPDGLGSDDCSKNEEAKNAECGGVINLSDWTTIESPNYPDPGYDPDQKCSWLLKAKAGERVEIEFVEDFSILCTSTCADYVELKISSDLKTTGFRLCCYDLPEGSFVSETDTAIVIFRSQLSNDIGFKLRAKSSTKSPRTTPAPVTVTTTPVPVTVSGKNVWAEWGQWSDCSRSCGGCGIKSRVRVCKSKKCDGRRQEFNTCNLQACPIDKHCAKLLSSNRLCHGKVCTKPGLSEISSCDTPQCCPPFINVDGQCTADGIANDFLALSTD